MGALGDSELDISQAASVLQECYPKTIVTHEIKQAIKDKLIIQVSKTGSKMIGVLIAERDVNEVYVRRIGVIRSHRGKGYARGLIQSLVRLPGVDVVTMAVPGWDAGSVAFAHRCFFHQFGMDMNEEGHQLWRLSSRADASTRNRLESYFTQRPTRIGDSGRRH